MHDLISRQAAIAEVKKAYENDEMFDGYEYRLQELSSIQPLVLTCEGCRHVGTYDTDFPCSGCIRREKDYYEQER